jgi:hypothetical protein
MFSLTIPVAVITCKSPCGKNKNELFREIISKHSFQCGISPVTLKTNKGQQLNIFSALSAPHLTFHLAITPSYLT